MDYEQAREMVYGCLMNEMNKFQNEATPEQLAAYTQKQPQTGLAKRLTGISAKIGSDCKNTQRGHRGRFFEQSFHQKDTKKKIIKLRVLRDNKFSRFCRQEMS